MATEVKRVLVTGAAGHLGSHLSATLVKEGFHITGLDMAAPATPWAGGGPFLTASLADAAAVRKALAGIDLIVHCASIHPWKKYTDDQYLDANVKGTWHLYAAAEEAKIGRVV